MENNWKKCKIFDLKKGDLVRHINGGRPLIVIENYGDRVAIAEIIDIINEGAWEYLSVSHSSIMRSGEVRDDINCPECGEHHIDKDEWAKRLHKKHQCEKCGHIWKPHEHYTFGI